MSAQFKRRKKVKETQQVPMLLYLWVRYGFDRIEVGSRAKRAGHTHNNDTFAIYPSLQLADPVFQLHHHAAWETKLKEINLNVINGIQGFLTLQNPTREGVHAGGVVDGQHSDARLLFEEINGTSREGLQLLSDLLLIKAVDASLQQPWKQITHSL